MHLEFASRLRRCPDFTTSMLGIEAAYNLLSATFHAGGKLLICGSGGRPLTTIILSANS